MGYNTVIQIRNDAVSFIREHPEQFVAGLTDAVGQSIGFEPYHMRPLEVRAGGHTGAAIVMPSHHADERRLYVSHGNLLVDLDPASPITAGYLNRPGHHMRYYLREHRRFASDRISELDHALRELLP